MGQPYVGEIRMFGGNFAPVGWMFCEGQLLPISENETLFQLLGTTYGGDGQNTFALPDMRGRIPMHQGNGVSLAENGGVEEITLTVQQIPIHTHTPVALAAGAGTNQGPGNSTWARVSTGVHYTTANPNFNLNSSALAPVGGSQPHTNMMPFVCVSFIISLFGIFPSVT